MHPTRPPNLLSTQQAVDNGAWKSKPSSWPNAIFLALVKDVFETVHIVGTRYSKIDQSLPISTRRLPEVFSRPKALCPPLCGSGQMEPACAGMLMPKLQTQVSPRLT